MSGSVKNYSISSFNKAWENSELKQNNAIRIIAITGERLTLPFWKFVEPNLLFSKYISTNLFRPLVKNEFDSGIHFQDRVSSLESYVIVALNKMQKISFVGESFAAIRLEKMSKILFQTTQIPLAVIQLIQEYLPEEN
jgi:hypothetical protein